jgi:molybdate transport system ATP-binding protein
VLFLSRRAATLPAGITHVLAMEDGRVRACGPRAEVLAALAERVSETRDPRPLPVPDGLAPWRAGPLIELERVQARYGEHVVLEDISLRLDPGEHLCLAGPNGCGKSTLLALICGDNPRAYGQQVRVCGHLRGDGEPIEALRRRFGVVSNALHLAYPPRTRVTDVVASGLHDTLGLYETPGPQDASCVRGWLAALDLAGHANECFDTLSFGLQRLVLVARAVAKWPPLLILDEPCSGLDAPNRRRVLDLVERIAATGHTQLLYVSHEREEMPRCITRRLEFRPTKDGLHALVEASRV